MDPRKVRFVLHRPQSAENLGAAARAMKNFGLFRLEVVVPAAWAGLARSAGAVLPEGPRGDSPVEDPEGAGPSEESSEAPEPPGAREDVLARARRMARHASPLLDAAGFHADLRPALSGATWVCGTSSRRVEGLPRLDPRALAREVAIRSRSGDVAIVFGEERRGLSDADLRTCQALCTIPTSPEYDSMNLAQAVAVLAYEVGTAHEDGAAPGSARVDPARHETLEALWDRTRTLLSAAGYLNPQNPDLVLTELRRVLARAEPTQREVELLAAAVAALERIVRERG